MAKISKIVVHPGYSPDTMENDIAIITVSQTALVNWSIIHRSISFQVVDPFNITATFGPFNITNIPPVDYEGCTVGECVEFSLLRERILKDIEF